MKKQPEITKQTKQNLADAFWQIYCKKRIEKITVKDITDTNNILSSCWEKTAIRLFGIK